MLTIIPFKDISREKEDPYFILLAKISNIVIYQENTPYSELVKEFFEKDKNEFYQIIFKTENLSRLTTKSLEKNVKTLAEFLTIFSNVISQIEDLNINNMLHCDLFERLINFICTSFSTLFNTHMNEAFAV